MEPRRFWPAGEKNKMYQFLIFISPLFEQGSLEYKIDLKNIYIFCKGGEIRLLLIG